MNPLATEPFTISRTMDASRDRVWNAFTNPEAMQHWWGPKGFAVTFQRMDFRPGGTYHYRLRSPDGKDLWGKFEYLEISKPARLVWFNMFSDPQGGTTQHPLNPDWPTRMRTVVTFVEKDGKTVVTVQWTPIDASAAERETFEKGRSSMNQGWSGTFEQLEAYLKSK